MRRLARKRDALESQKAWVGVVGDEAQRIHDFCNKRVREAEDTELLCLKISSWINEVGH